MTDKFYLFRTSIFSWESDSLYPCGRSTRIPRWIAWFDNPVYHREISGLFVNLLIYFNYFIYFKWFCCV